MISRSFWFGVLLALAAITTASPAQAKDQPCTDGVDCYCDRVKNPADALYDPNVVFCEDFEDPVLDQDGRGTGWTDKYGAAAGSCFDPTDYRHTVEGTCPTCCLNVVTDSTCEVPGQTDCSFDGARSLGHRYRPRFSTGAGSGTTFQKGRNFGVTMAVKFSHNWVNGYTPKKTNEFGSALHCLLGCSSGLVPLDEGNPFQGMLWVNTPPTTWNTIRGRARFDGTSAFVWAPWVPNDYSFSRDFGLDRWHCRRFHIKDIGTANATIRDWIDDRLLVHVENVDLRGMRDAGGIGSIMWNSYYNEGYQGDSIAYRYEDNVVVTVGPEPPTCEEIGFDLGASSPPDGSSTPPPDGSLSDPVTGSDSPTESPTSNPPSQGSGLELSVAQSTSGWTIEASIAQGVGPYQILFDCGANGGWDGVYDTVSGDQTHSCPSTGSASLVNVWAWDRGSNQTFEGSATLDVFPADEIQPLGAPGRPVLVK